jgi:hypothetical protein
MFLHTAYQSQGEKVMRGNTLGYGSDNNGSDHNSTVRHCFAFRELDLPRSLHFDPVSSHLLFEGWEFRDDYPESKLIVVGSHLRFHFESMSVPSIWLTSLLKSYPKAVKHDSANQQAKGCFTRKDQFLTPSRTVT